MRTQQNLRMMEQNDPYNCKTQIKQIIKTSLNNYFYLIHTIQHIKPQQTLIRTTTVDSKKSSSNKANIFPNKKNIALINRKTLQFSFPKYLLTL